MPLAESAPLAVRGWQTVRWMPATYEPAARPSRSCAGWSGSTGAARSRVACRSRWTFARSGPGFATGRRDQKAALRRWRSGELQGRDRRNGFSWEVTRLELRDVDAAAVAGAQVQSRVMTGVLRANGRLDREAAAANAKLELGVRVRALACVVGPCYATLDGRGGGASLSLESPEVRSTWTRSRARTWGGLLRVMRTRGARLHLTDLRRGVRLGPGSRARSDAAAELEKGHRTRQPARTSGGARAPETVASSAARAIHQCRLRKVRGNPSAGGQFALALARWSVTLEGGARIRCAEVSSWRRPTSQTVRRSAAAPAAAAPVRLAAGPGRVAAELQACTRA